VRHDAQLLGHFFQPLQQEEPALGAAFAHHASRASIHSRVSCGSASRAAAMSWSSKVVASRPAISALLICFGASTHCSAGREMPPQPVKPPPYNPKVLPGAACPVLIRVFP
jgi:hypothetical protein